MGVGIFLILFILGIILSTVGGLIGLIDAFRVSPVWGLLAFFVPFALLVFCIKFWGSRKWAKISLMTTMGGLLAMLAGVPFMAGFVRQQMADLENQMGETSIEQPPIDQPPIDQPPIDQPPIDQPPIEQAPAEGGEDFATPMVPAAPQLANIASAELIQSTDPEERIRQINSRRPDPFATVPIPPPPQITPPPPGSPTSVAPTGGVPATPTAAAPTGTTAPRPGGTAAPTGTTTPRPGGTAAAPTGTTTPRPGGTAAPTGTTTPRPGGTAAPTGTTTPRPGGTAAAPTAPGGTRPTAQPSAPAGSPASPEEIALAPLPALPEPTQAQQVTVTGVVTIGDRNYAIVQSPDEPTGRYVSVGQRVAGGSVLVKRIDMRGSEPVVVLEQNGVEVSHSVGVQEEAEGSAAT